MRSFKTTALSLGLWLAAISGGAALAQPPAAPTAAPAPAAAAPIAPNYVTIPMEIMVNKPAAEVWAKVGKYCDIAAWLPAVRTCTITAGPASGEIGSVRSVGGEIMVGKTALSYTYAQRPSLTNPAAAVRYNFYHGCLEAVPVTATTSKLVYTLMYDNEYVAGDEAAKAAEMNNRRTQFTAALGNMKIIAEGGTVPPAPPAPARGGGAPGGAPGAGRGG